MRAVINSEKVYGKDVALMRGSTVKRKAVPSKIEHISYLAPADQTLNTDIMYVFGHALLISVSSPLGMAFITHLGKGIGTRAVAPVRKALTEHISELAARGFHVKVVQSDGEGAVSALKLELAAKGIVLNPAGTGKHVPTVERKIREIKEVMRGIYNTLPYTLPHTLISWLAYFAVTRINMYPHRGAYLELSPREAFLGRKPSYKIDSRIPFGAYANRTMKARTEPAIALLPIGNTTGSYKFLSLLTGGYIIRDIFTELPTPDGVIKHMNDIARREGVDPTAPLVLSMGSLIIEGTPDFLQGVDIAHDDVVPVTITDDLIALADDVPSNPDIINVEQAADTSDASQFVATPSNNPNSNPSTVDNTLDGTHNSWPDQPPAVDYDTGPPPDNFESYDYPGNSPTDIMESQDTSVVPDASIITPTTTVTPSADPEQPHYNTRSTSRGARVHWDPRTNMPTTALPEQRKRASKGERKHVFNISVRKAMKRPDMRAAAAQAMFRELLQLYGKECIPPAPPWLKRKKKAIRSFMFLKEKFKADGSFDKLKARLVAGGNEQDKSELLY
jgi:hypothetical protein